MTYRKKLIEVALPLKAMNEASVREKSIRHGHPSTLHLWWSRKPLATCRAVLFASLVDDPSAHPEEFSTEQDQERERLRLFQLMEQLITWENSNNQEIFCKSTCRNTQIDKWQSTPCTRSILRRWVYSPRSAATRFRSSW